MGKHINYCYKQLQDHSMTVYT